MTACSFAVSAHVCWNWAVRAARTAIPLFILGHTLSTCRSLDMRRKNLFVSFAGFCNGSPGEYRSLSRRAELQYGAASVSRCILLAGTRGTWPKMSCISNNAKREIMR
jgi:hypothetical protein